jgi:hypothetical protein
MGIASLLVTAAEGLLIVPREGEALADRATLDSNENFY